MFTKLSVPMAMMALSQADGQFFPRKPFGGLKGGLKGIDVIHIDDGTQHGVGGENSMFQGLIGFQELDMDGFDPLFGIKKRSGAIPAPNGCPNWRTINAKCNNVFKPDWGTAGEFMPRSVGGTNGNFGASTTDAGSAQVYDSSRWTSMGGGSTPAWGGHDPRMVSNSACSNTNLSYTINDWSSDGGIPVGNDGSRGDNVITYAQVMDHELDATGPDAYGSTATDSGTEYKFGDGEDGNVAGKLKRTQDAAKNGITSYVDAGILYGETATERQKLRMGNSAYMKYTCLEQSGNPVQYCQFTEHYLPISSQICGFGGNKTCKPTEFFMANPTKRGCFYAGDFRANENPALVAYHTLFLRMHNFYAASYLPGNCPTSYDGANSGTSSCAFEKIRHRVGYEEQYITYDEWLPAYTGTWSGGSYSKLAGAAGQPVLSFSTSGVGGMPAYSSYTALVRGSVRHIFATATFRQHTGVNHTMQLAAGGNLELDQTYFESCVWTAGGQGPGCSSQSGQGAADTDTVANGIQTLCDVLAGQASQLAKKGDTEMVTEERNQLMYKAKNFGNNSEGHSGGFEGFGGDLASLNIFRGRDHNIAGYRAAFTAYFSSPQGPWTPGTIHSYHGLSGAGSNGSIDLANAYTTINDVDVWTGALAEAKLTNGGTGTSMLGAMLTFDVVTQFRDLRDGDRFFYQNPTLPSWSSPVWTGTPDKRGLNNWAQLTSGAQVSGPSFQHDSAAWCTNNGGTIQTHYHWFFDFRSKECGSGGSGYSGGR